MAPRPRPAGRRLPLPGGREVVVHFDEVHIGRRREASGAARDFAVELPVPGRVALPDGGTVEARAARGPARRRVDGDVVAVPGDRWSSGRAGPAIACGWASRELSLKRYLAERRVPAFDRPALPLVAAGARVVWVAGQAPATEADGAARFVRIKLRVARQGAGDRA